MDNNVKDFEKRLKKIEKGYKKTGRHKVGSNPKAKAYAGRTTYGSPDTGMNYYRKREGFKFWTFMRRAMFFGILAFFCALGLRVFMSIQMGADAYDARVGELREGTQGEQYAAMGMQRGPLMLTVENFVREVMNKPDESAPETALPNGTAEPGDVQTPNAEQAPSN
ncbi:hypothetical protein GCM10008927_14680 [Amylibacter ulvae]|uniref:Uncharacterized protein n=1 Tax=Paramylibacter ulvae TaxID=1651968 RepID=A0ABQ3D0Y1_9RHOB|nr:hypothetical protein [Amylibacter ulvae]GHA50602.1 hypothetical protein GCM10008927_14680 [Amylibacter ulvae]